MILFLLLLLLGASFGGWLLMRAFSNSRKREDWARAEVSDDTNAISWPALEIHVTAKAHGRVDSAPLTARPDDVWIPCGKTATLGAMEIPGGMLYVGKALATVDDPREIEPSLIDPSLPTDFHHPDFTGEGMDYWPSYSSISPQCRAAYIHWLARGRTDPGVPIGYVFLAFYAIERRLLSATKHSVTENPEVPALLAEVERLLSIYGDNQSFRGYATELVALVESFAVGDSVENRDPPELANHWEFPLALRIGLGQLVGAGMPIPPAWALTWFRASGESRLRTAATRCADEFHALFLKRYVEKYGHGMRVKPNKARLAYVHRPASPTFRSGSKVHFGDLPDLIAVIRPIRQMQKIADKCMQDLDAYSRYLGKNPDRRGSVAAFGLLPAELAPNVDGGEVAELRRWIDLCLAGESTIVMSGKDLMSRWECSRPDRMSKKEVVALAHVLQKFGVGVEPDIRFVGPSISADGKVVLFRMPPGHPDAPSAEYRAGSVLLHLAAVVAAADGTVTREEEEVLENHLERALKLGAAESARLGAHLRWLLTEQPGMAGLKKRLAGTSPEVSARFAEFAVIVAGADGVIDPTEIKVLRKLYKTLGLDEDHVYAHINELMVPESGEPVSVRAGQASKRGYAIPGKPTPDRTRGFQLDMLRVDKKLAETAAVSLLLAEIFVEDNEDPDDSRSVAKSNGRPGSSAIRDLDEPHSTLVHGLGTRETVERAAFEALADDLGLLPDGAIDRINDAAFELCEEPLLEGHDPIEVNPDVLRELLS